MQVRIARPTAHMEEAVAFYRDGAGLAELGGFRGHAGYDGVFLGRPDVHLELTRHDSGRPLPSPTTEDLLVLYLDDRAALDAALARLAALGHRPTPAENPYWAQIGAVHLRDPDGYGLVLVPGPWR
jgi:catechol 2,3-dioxygenase-like lactoylglutathione lyase family enzyme